ncbi:hypothetical protein MRB53_036325 [Persea americana]|nr:hypothetical protein MRB53_036416 [Persea americana]KAJ8614912.1 hypothetical protein MRB53_036325 [Persea americana]
MQFSFVRCPVTAFFPFIKSPESRRVLSTVPRRRFRSEALNFIKGLWQFEDKVKEYLHGKSTRTTTRGRIVTDLAISPCSLRFLFDESVALVCLLHRVRDYSDFLVARASLAPPGSSNRKRLGNCRGITNCNKTPLQLSSVQYGLHVREGYDWPVTFLLAEENARSTSVDYVAGRPVREFPLSVSLVSLDSLGKASAVMRSVFRLGLVDKSKDKSLLKGNSSCSELREGGKFSGGTERKEVGYDSQAPKDRKVQGPVAEVEEQVASSVYS